MSNETRKSIMLSPEAHKNVMHMAQHTGVTAEDVIVTALNFIEVPLLIAELDTISKTRAKERAATAGRRKQILDAASDLSEDELADVLAFIEKS